MRRLTIHIAVLSSIAVLVSLQLRQWEERSERRSAAATEGRARGRSECLSSGPS